MAAYSLGTAMKHYVCKNGGTSYYLLWGIDSKLISSSGLCPSVPLGYRLAYWAEAIVNICYCSF